MFEFIDGYDVQATRREAELKGENKALKEKIEMVKEMLSYSKLQQAL